MVDLRRFDGTLSVWMITCKTGKGFAPEFDQILDLN